MADILIRNVDSDVVALIDSDAEREGISRSEYLRRQLRVITNPLGRVTMDDLRRSAEVAKGVLDEDLMREAWH